ncbi:fluoride efflux transporter CrcB [Halomarina ordinaria]|uniref:Fluoride-specific ion channel FluC n=1 Tax=Halomarina ordinaria TaxID=3033939 RepID=A0ABD5U7W5_9EURY|nr:fluoride efflux transporter CrcB [Halomarina sp. PSRA2]
MVALDPAQLVGLGGVLGAVARYLVTEAVDVEGLPLGTVLVNVLGSFVLGALTFAGAGDDLLLALGTGACGSFTTFSSFSVQTVELWAGGDRLRAFANAFGTLLAALGAVGFAWVVFG